MKNQSKIIVLWGVILFGYVFHSLIEMMPLFFGASIAMPDAKGTIPPGMDWMSLIFYLLPMICIVVVVSCTSKGMKLFNLVLAGLFALLNVYHLITHIMEGGSAVQPLLLTFILLCSVLLFLASLRWKKGNE